MQLCKLNYEKILTPHTHILTRRKKEREERKDINSRALDNGNVVYLALLFCLCALTLAPAASCMSGRAKYCRSREGWAYTTPVRVRTGVDSAHWTVHTTRVSLPILCDKQWDRPAPGVCSLPSDDSCFCSTASWWMLSLSSFIECWCLVRDSKSAWLMTEADFVSSLSRF